MQYIVDLNHSVLMPFQLIIDLSYQLDKQVAPHIKNEAMHSYFEVSSANDWINLEAFGNMTAAKAKALVQMLACVGFYRTEEGEIDEEYTHLVEWDDDYESEREPFVLKINATNHELTIDNVYTIIFLADKLKNFEIIIHREEKLKSDKLLAAILREKKCSFSFVTSEFEKTHIVDELNTQRVSFLSSAGFDFVDENDRLNFTDEKFVEKMINFGWTCLKVGAYEVATNLLQQLQDKSEIRKADQEQLLMHLQLVRYHSHQYQAVAEQGYPQFAHLDQRCKNYMHYIQAYAATLARNLPVAQKSFEACKINENLEVQDEFNLYQLNIFALFNVLSKRTDIAYDLEMKIEQYIEDHQITTVGLKYVNFINIARLYKHRMQYDLSHQYYQKAYQLISGGAYSTSDFIYYHMNLGSLFEAEKKPQQALLAWFKAALHWLVADNPYALAWRAKIILCSENTTELNQPLCLSKVTEFFVKKLNHLIKSNKIQLKNTKELNFIQNNEDMLFGIGYLFCHTVLYGIQTGQEDYTHRQLFPLKTLLSGLVHYYIKLSERIDTIAVDILSENLLQQYADYSVLKAIHSCSWKIQDSFMLPRQSDATKYCLKMNSHITEITSHSMGLLIKYKRNFMNKVIDDSYEVELIKKIQSSEVSLGNLSMTAYVLSLLYKNVFEIAPQKVMAHH